MKVLILTKRQSILAILILTLCTISGCDKLKQWLSKNKVEQQVEQQIKQQTPQVNISLPDFTTLVEQQGPTVVNIQATRNVQSVVNVDNFSGEERNLPENDAFYEYFKRMLPNVPQMPQTDDDEYNFGSGFIVNKSGYILTNAHVVNGLSNIKVLLNDKREFQAKLIGSDLQSDIALLKIEADNLPVVQLGNPKELKVGEWVAAIGAPFGFDNSVTSGIVSAKGRSLPDENYTPFIQTDVAINPGNSGGPLFNLKGQVVGINSQIYSRSGGFMGISFAIPIDVAMNVADQLLKTGKVQRGRLGVVIQEVNYNLAKSFGLDQANGALISQVISGGAADKAGLLMGDIVQTVNGEVIHNSSDLPVMVGLLPPGKKITLGIWRQGKPQLISVVLDDAVNNGNIVDMSGDGDLTVSPDSKPFVIERLGLILQPAKDGLMVIQVNGIAAKAGMHRGDIIIAVGQKIVNNETDLNQVLGNIGKNIPLLVRRGNNTSFLALIEP